MTDKAAKRHSKSQCLSIEFPDQTKRNFCRLGRLKARPEQSPPHCYRDAHRPRWRYSTTRAPEGSTRATACPSAQRSTPQRTPLVHLVLTYLTHTLRPVLTASYNAVPHPRPHHPKPDPRRARCTPRRAHAASCACSRRRKGRGRGGVRRGGRPWCSMDLGWYETM